MPKTKLNRVTMTLCDKCLDGDGGECFVPGCSLWMVSAPDINLRERIVDLGGSIEPIHDNVEHEFEGDEADCKVCGEGRQHYLHGSLHPAGFSVGIKPCGTCDIYPGDSRCTECDHYTGT